MTPEANALKRFRRKAARQLPAIMLKHGNKCYWCRRPLIIRRNMNAALVFKETGDYVYWYQDHQEHMRLKATVDHVHPLAEGGTNDPDNLVPACGACNRARTSGDPQKFAARLERIWHELSQKPKMSGSPIHSYPRYVFSSPHSHT